jgi:hypothetical protein
LLYRVLICTEVASRLVTRSRQEVDVSTTPTVFLRHRPPYSCDYGFIPSWAYLLFRVRSCLSPVRPKPNTSSGFPSSSRHEHLKSTNDELPHPPNVPPAAFLTLSTVYSFRFLAGLFHPTTASRIPLQGFLPAAKPPRLATIRALLSLPSFTSR